MKVEKIRNQPFTNLRRVMRTVIAYSEGARFGRIPLGGQGVGNRAAAGESGEIATVATRYVSSASESVAAKPTHAYLPARRAALDAFPARRKYLVGSWEQALSNGLIERARLRLT